MAANEKLLAADEAAEGDDDDEEEGAADGSAQVSDLTAAIGKVRLGPARSPSAKACDTGT